MINTRKAWRATEVLLWLAAAGLAWLVLARITSRITDRASAAAGIPR